jgi:hypothetical protein
MHAGLASIPRRAGRGRARQAGAAAVEFALVAILFFTLVLGVAEWARALFVWNSAVEATRFGARVAVVCDIDAAAVATRMGAILPGLDPGQVSIAYTPAGCNRASCESVTVGIQNISVTPLIPFVGVAIPVPPFSTRLVRESLESTNAAGHSNPVCFPGTTPAYPAPAVY